ncbi:uncharacterized protein LOC133953280 [Platichthys flesus]|uniref:uncharacterized protein LOC133953280 n=1 Tax=Platichthys flesus TaxID=8260 RepID=UPI002DBA5F71|nr:uncharacterized protein LOC133953280 [Platichthys flesus]
MATKPEAWQQQGPINSIDKQPVNESWVHGEVGSTGGLHSSPLQEKRAPRAEPEEDIDDLELGAQGQTLQENQTLSGIQTGDATDLENQESTTTRETLETVTEEESELSQAEEESENSADVCEDAFPPPPPLLIASSTDECLEAEGFPSLADEVSEWISDAKIIPDPAEDLISPDNEWALTTQLTELVYHEVESISKEMTADAMAAEENDTQLHFSPDASDNSEPGNNISVSAQHSSSDSNNSDDVRSPPFADESEEEEEVSMDIASCQQEWSTLDIRAKLLRPSYSSADGPTSPPAVPSAKQQGELLRQCQSALVPKRANQEATQQVQGRSSPPLSTVAMEPSNQGGAASQGSGCIGAGRERHSGAGRSTEGECKQTGEEEGQKESEPDRSRAEGQHSAGQLRSVQRQERYMKGYFDQGVNCKHSEQDRMESDCCDDSQSDSGVSADFSPGSTLGGNTPISTGNPASKETPIEREIRRTIEREHSLRRSRGLPNPPTSPEYVEIPSRKNILSEPLNIKSESSQGKDKQFAGKKMQQEIHEETKREQDLVQLGKVPGFYDKGTVRQLKDKKQLFEAFQQPSDSTLSVSTRSKTTSWSSFGDVSTLEENQEDTLSQTSTIGALYVERRQNTDVLSPPASPYSAKGRYSTYSTPSVLGFSKETDHQVISMENNLSVPAQKLYHAKLEVEPVTTVNSGDPNISSQGTGTSGGIIEEEEEEEEEEEVALKDNPFFKLRSSTNVAKVEQDIQETQEREKELRKQRKSLYGGARGVQVGGETIPTMSSTSLNGPAVPDIPDSPPRWRNGPSAAQQSAGKVSIWLPAQAEEGRTAQQEVPCSPRSPRQKTPLVQRWESGLINGHNEGDD